MKLAVMGFIFGSIIFMAGVGTAAVIDGAAPYIQWVRVPRTLK